MEMKKSIIKKWAVLIGALIAVCMLSVSAFAAPSKVKGVKVSAGETSCKVTWKKATGCSGYNIYLLDVAKNEMKTIKVSSARTTSKKITGLSKVSDYQVQVAAFKGSSVGAASSVVSFKTKVLSPGKIKISVTSETPKKTRITWKKASTTDYYEVWYKEPGKNKKKTRLETNLKTRSYTTNKLKLGRSYTFYVRGVREYEGKKYYGPYSSTKITPYTKKNDKKLASKINTSYAYSSGTNAGKNYSRAQLEAYVNYSNGGKRYPSANHYLIWCNTNNFHVYIFTNKNRSSKRWSLLYSTACIIGRSAHNTPRGTFVIKGRKMRTNYGSNHSEYISYFCGENAIHSLLYPAQPDSLGRGYKASGGCIRVPRKYCKFVYNNCQGSTLIVR